MASDKRITLSGGLADGAWRLKFEDSGVGRTGYRQTTSVDDGAAIIGPGLGSMRRITETMGWPLTIRQDGVAVIDLPVIDAPDETQWPRRDPTWEEPRAV